MISDVSVTAVGGEGTPWVPWVTGLCDRVESLSLDPCFAIAETSGSWWPRCVDVVDSFVSVTDASGGVFDCLLLR